MKKKFALALSAVMLLSMASCGKKVDKLTDSSNTIQRVTEEEPIIDPLEAIENPDGIVPCVFNDEVVQVPSDVGYFVDTLIPLENGQFIMEYKNTNDKTCYYRFDSGLKNFAAVEYEIPEEIQQYADYDEYNFRSTLHFNADGSFIAYFRIRPEPDGRSTRENELHAICSYDENGKRKSFATFEVPDECYVCYPSGDEYCAIYPRLADGDDLIFDFQNPEEDKTIVGIYKISSADGLVKSVYSDEIAPDNYFGIQLCRDRDYKNIAIISAKPDGAEDEVLNFYEIGSDGTLGNLFHTAEAGEEYSEFTNGFGEYRLIFINGNVTGIRDDGTVETLIDIKKSGLDIFGSVLKINDTDYITVENKYNKAVLVKLTPATNAQFGEKKNLTLYTVINDSQNLINFVNDYNRQSKDYKVEIVEYASNIGYIYDENGDIIGEDSSLVDALTRDLIQGNAPDLYIDLDYSLYKNLSKKGVFVDLGEYMDKDEEFTRDKFMPNLLNAMADNSGKISGIPSTFNCSAFVVKSKFYDKNTWTLDEMINFYDENEATAEHLYDEKKKYEMLSMMSFTMEDLIDFNNATCNFDSPEFVKILEFCNRFDSEQVFYDKVNVDSDGLTESDRYWADRWTWFANDKVLIKECAIGVGNQYNLIKEQEANGEDLTIIGYPSDSGNGGRIILNNVVSIAESCQNKDAAWDFVKFALKEHYNPFGTGMSCLIENFEDMMDKEVGAVHTFSGTAPTPLTVEQAQMMKDYIYSCNSVTAPLDEDLWKIIQNEAQTYFEGGQTAKQAAEMIQNRASILISEKY